MLALVDDSRAVRSTLDRLLTRPEPPQRVEVRA
jgi:hypothetical protein